MFYLLGVGKQSIIQFVQQCISSVQSILSTANYFSPVMRKPYFCICENKGADQLPIYCAADQRLCFRYIASAIPLLPKYEISSLFKLSSVTAQPGLYRTWSETPKTGFLELWLIFEQVIAFIPQYLHLLCILLK